MTVQLPTSWKRRTTPALFRRQFPSRRPQSRPRARRRTRTHSPSLPLCLSYADTVRCGGDAQQTLRINKEEEPLWSPSLSPLKTLFFFLLGGIHTRIFP